MMRYIICIIAGFIAGVVVMYIIVLRLAGNTRRKQSQLPERRSSRGFEFSKVLAVWAAVTATAASVASFALSAFDKQPVSDFAAAVFSTCVGYLITYAGKSAVEKVSRNKHGIDENGKPYV